jgi:ubiquinone/menaquinone biosynthesis C-methylase UbiE
MGKVFNAYARYYDLLYNDKAYHSESAYIHSIIKQYVPNAKSVLELGSGTGAHAEHSAIPLGNALFVFVLTASLLLLSRVHQLPSAVFSKQPQF